MNKSAATIFTLLFIDLVFMLIWAWFLSPTISYWGNFAVTHGAVGIEAFFYANINLFIFMFFLLVNMIFLYVGGK